MPTSVLIVDDHPIIIAGCRAIFLESDDIDIREAGSVSEGLAKFREHAPDVVVIDINLPDGSGFDLAQTIMREHPQAGIVLFSMSDAAALAVRSVDIGAKGYVSKMGDPRDLREAVLAVKGGRRWLPPAVLQEMALDAVSPAEQSLRLSTRELHVLRAIATGSKLSDIAKELDTSYAVIASDCVSLRSKFNARTNFELVRIAAEQRLV